MKITLEEIPGMDARNQTVCKVRAMAVDGKSPALAALADWESKEVNNYRKIMKVLRMIGVVGRIRDEKKVKKCQNTDYGDIYEARADKSSARLMFFYDTDESMMIICTNSYWKGTGNQNTAFKYCDEFRKLYLAGKKNKK